MPRPSAHIRTLILALSPACVIAPCAASWDDTTLRTFVYANSSSPLTPVYRQVSGSTWGAQGSANSLSASADWQVIRDCPRRDESALVSLSADRALHLQLWSATSWGSVSTLTPDCGTSFTRVYDAAYESDSGELLVVYRKTASTSVSYRSYATPSPAEQSYAMGLNDEPRWIGLAPVPGGDTVVMLVATDVRLYGAVWNGSTFGNLTTLETALPTAGFPCDVAASGSGTAVAAWGRSSANDVRYATWNGTAWSAVGTALTASGTVRGVDIAGNPDSSSSELLLACLDGASDIRACRWTGSAWTGATTVETDAGSTAERRFGIAYQPDGGGALLAWHRSAQTALRYRTWDGTAWSATATGTDMGTETTRIEVVPGPLSGDVSLAVRHRGVVTTLGDYNAYAQTGTATVNGTSAGPVDDQVAGVTLPTAPTNAAGTTNVSYGNNATATLAPGARGTLTAGNNLVLNLTNGTYVFNQVQMNNAPTWNVDTSLGDTSIIIASGNFNVVNSFTLTRSGSGQVVIHVVNGNFDINNNGTLEASVLVYNGNFLAGLNLRGDGAFYASGNVTTGANAVLTNSNQPVAPSDARLSLLRFAGGAMGSPTLCSSAVAGWAHRQNFSLAAPTNGAPVVTLTSWREVTGEE